MSYSLTVGPLERPDLLADALDEACGVNLDKSEYGEATPAVEEHFDAAVDALRVLIDGFGYYDDAPPRAYSAGISGHANKDNGPGSSLYLSIHVVQRPSEWDAEVEVAE